MSLARRGALGLPDIIATAFNLYVRNARQFLILGLLGAALSVLEYVGLQALGDALGVKGLSGSESASGNNAAAVFVLLSSLLLTTALINFLADAIVVPAAFEALLGRRPRPRTACVILWASLPAVAVAWLLVGVSATIGVMLVITIPIVVFWLVRWSFVIQVITREGLPAVQALARSAALVRGAWWRVFAVQLAILFLSALPGLVLRPLSNAFTGPVVDYILVGVAPWLALPYAAIARTVLYADIKLRKGEELQPSARIAG